MQWTEWGHGVGAESSSQILNEFRRQSQEDLLLDWMWEIKRGVQNSPRHRTALPFPDTGLRAGGVMWGNGAVCQVPVKTHAEEKEPPRAWSSGAGQHRQARVSNLFTNHRCHR